MIEKIDFTPNHDFPKDWYRGNFKWINDRLAFMTRAGSFSYGTNVIGSDLDLRGIFFAPREYYLGCSKNIEQIVQNPKPESQDPDVPDAQYLLEIRNGKMKYEELVEWADKEDKELTQLMKNSSLPHSPNFKELDNLCIELIEESFR